MHILNLYQLLFTLPPIERNVCMSVSVFVCQRSYLQNYTSDLHQFLCALPMAVARSSSGDVVIRYVLPVYG